ncbi:MAG: hypothetical protein ACI4PO_02570 [Faecousia sp.]
MSAWIGLKVFGDVCVCFAVFGALPDIFPHSYMLIWPAVLCGLGAAGSALASERGKPGLRFLALLLPASSVLIPQTMGELVIFLPAVVYTAVVIVRGELALEYYTYRQSFQKSLTGLAVYFVVLFAFDYMQRAAGDSHYSFDTGTILQYGAIHGLVGVMIQRQLRLGSEDRKNGRRLNAVQMAVTLTITAGIVLTVVAAEEFLRKSFETILHGGLALLMAPMWLLAELFDRDLKAFDEEKPGASSGITRPSVQQSIPSTVAESTPHRPEAEQFHFPWELILLAVVIVVLMVFLLRAFAYRKTVHLTKESTGGVELLERNGIPNPQSNRGKLRRYYRDFLKTERKRGVKLRTNQTSEDILRKISSDTDQQAAAELRRLYIGARYDLEREISDDQVKAAKAALKKCKNG